MSFPVQTAVTVDAFGKVRIGTENSFRYSSLRGLRFAIGPVLIIAISSTFK